MTTTEPTIHQRAFSIHIDNPMDGTATCTFQQEKVVVVNGETIRQPIGELVVPFDPNHAESAALHQLLTEYYMQLIAPPTTEEPVVEEPAPEPTTDEAV